MLFDPASPSFFLNDEPAKEKADPGALGSVGVADAAGLVAVAPAAGEGSEKVGAAFDVDGSEDPTEDAEGAGDGAVKLNGLGGAAAAGAVEDAVDDAGRGADVDALDFFLSSSTFLRCAAYFSSAALRRPPRSAKASFPSSRSIADESSALSETLRPRSDR